MTGKHAGREPAAAPKKQAALEEAAPSSRLPAIEEGDPRHIGDPDGNESLARKRAARQLR